LLVFTDKHGERAALARELDVSRQTLNVWLSGDAMPSAEYTLRLLEWATAKEANLKKSAGSAETRPARTTQTRKSKHEKPSSDRKKK
jgi:transcriptional regulator with XRE-family HTH domain